MRNLLIILAVSIFLVSCKSQPPTADITEPLEEIQIATPVTASSGSLWPGEQHSLYADLKARIVGDIVTVTISEQASASKEASTDSDRTSSISAAIPHLFGLENSSALLEKNTNLDLTNLIEASFANKFSGGGKTVRKEDLIASLTTQVIRVYPNGNLMIRGGKEVRVNEETQVIHLTGIIRPVDILADNTVDSKNVLNARISYTGKGALSDKQKPGWLMRTIDLIWPF